MARYPVPSHSGTVLRGAQSRSFGALARVGYPVGAVGGSSEVKGNPEVNPIQVALGPRFFRPPAGTSGQVVAAGLATETDTALAMTVLIQRRSFPTEAKDISGAEPIQIALGSRIIRPSGKAIPVGLSLETDTALAMTVLIQRRSFPTQKPRETIEAIQVLLGTRLYRPLGRAFDVGIASETDTALSITSLSTRTASLKPLSAPAAIEAIQVALGTRIFRPLGKAAPLNLVSETDTAFAITALIQRRSFPIQKPRETVDPIQVALTSRFYRVNNKSVLAGIATETDTAFAITVVTSRPSRSTQGRPTVDPIQVALGTRFFRVNNKSVQVGLATENDTALAISGGLVAAVVQKIYRAVEQPQQVLTEQRSRIASALVKSTIYPYADPAPLETDTALAMSVLKTKAIGIASETDTAFTPKWAPKIRVTGIATETDTALALGAAATPTQVKVLRSARLVDPQPAPGSRTTSQLVDVGGSAYGPPAWNGTSPNTAIRAGGTNRVSIARTVDAAERYVEFDPASQALPILQTPGPWQVATEYDTANPFTINRSRATGIAIETDTALQMRRIKGVWTSTSQPTETDTAFSITRGTANRYIAVNYATETDSAFAITRRGPQVIILGQAYEPDEALALVGGSVPAEPRRNRQYGRYSLRNQRR